MMTSPEEEKMSLLLLLLFSYLFQDWLFFSSFDFIIFLSLLWCHCQDKESSLSVPFSFLVVPVFHLNVCLCLCSWLSFDVSWEGILCALHDPFCIFFLPFACHSRHLCLSLDILPSTFLLSVKSPRNERRKKRKDENDTRRILEMSQPGVEWMSLHVVWTTH